MRILLQTCISIVLLIAMAGNAQAAESFDTLRAYGMYDSLRLSSRQNVMIPGYAADADSLLRRSRAMNNALILPTLAFASLGVLSRVLIRPASHNQSDLDTRKAVVNGITLGLLAGEFGYLAYAGHRQKQLAQMALCLYDRKLRDSLGIAVPAASTLAADSSFRAGSPSAWRTYLARSVRVGDAVYPHWRHPTAYRMNDIPIDYALRSAGKMSRIAAPFSPGAAAALHRAGVCTVSSKVLLLVGSHSAYIGAMGMLAWFAATWGESRPDAFSKTMLAMIPIGLSMDLAAIPPAIRAPKYLERGLSLYDNALRDRYITVPDTASP